MCGPHKIGVETREREGELRAIVERLAKIKAYTNLHIENKITGSQIEGYRSANPADRPRCNLLSSECMA